MSGEPRGRPRSAATHQAILDATRELLVESGYGEMTIDRVAVRAGVGKQTIYRRWPSKAPLVAEAVMNAYDVHTDDARVGTADVLEQLRGWLRAHADFMSSPRNAALVRALAAAAAEDVDDADVLYRQLTGPEHSRLVALLRSGVETGSVRADADLESVADALIGAILYRMLTGSTGGPTLERADALLDAVVRGIGVGLP